MFFRITAPLLTFQKRRQDAKYEATFFLSAIPTETSMEKIIIIKYFSQKGWGNTRFDADNIRPSSYQHDPMASRMSAGSSSESEAHSVISSSSVLSGVSSKDKERKSGVFRLFSKKKKSNQMS